MAVQKNKNKDIPQKAQGRKPDSAKDISVSESKAESSTDSGAVVTLNLDTVKKYTALIFPWILVAVLMVLFIKSHFIYGDTDNFDIAIVVHGLYGDFPYGIMHPFASWLIYSLSKVFKDPDFFALYIHASVLLGGVSVMHCYFKKAKRVHGVLLTIAGAVFITFCMNVWNANFTVSAGFLAFCGIVNLYAAMEYDRTVWRSVCAAVFYALGYMLRNSSAQLFIPFVALYIAMDLLAEYMQAGHDVKERLRELIKASAPFLAIVLLLFISERAFYSGDEWRDAAEYSGYRATIEDYPMKPWEEVADKIDDVTETEYRAAVTWVLADTEVMDTERLKRIAEAGSERRHDIGNGGFGDCVAEIVSMIKGNEGSLLALFFLTLCMTAAALLKARDNCFRIAAALIPVGSFIILFYFTMIGRAPYRVWVCVIFAAVGTLTMMPERDMDMEVPEILKALCTLALVLSIYLSTRGIVFGEGYDILEGRKDPDEELFKVTYEGDTLYVWGGYSTQELEDGTTAIENSIDGWHNIGKYFIRQGKLPTREFTDHNIPTGDWSYGSVYFNEHLKKLGAENPAEAMLYREDTYLANGDENSYFVDFFLQFMREHYGEDIHYELTETSAYKLVKEN